ERAVAKGVHYPIPWKLIVIMAIAGLLSSFSGAFLSATEYVGAIHRVAATGIVGVVILVMAVSKRDRFDARFLAK
ncbi:LuxR family transcriptional regulator, partial [Bacteroides xylanisolvens]|nr:LuxR family transcriptional regulator [Bacteroides xylanisolvens]